MRRNGLFLAAALLLAAAVSPVAKAATYNFSFAGSGVSGLVQLTYGTGTDAKYAQAFQVTAISGTFTDTNSGLGIVNTPILGLVPINRATPEPDNLLAPNDFSRYTVGAGLPPENNGTLSYDNLFYPGGSPQTASDYPFHGGVFDIYGMLFTISGNRVVNLWSNGDFSGTGAAPVQYGVAVAGASGALDYVGEVSQTPEPSAFLLLGSGLAGLMALRRKTLFKR